MPELRDQHDLLIRYLLGVASAAEREVVEEQCFADDSGVSVLLRAEDELIDDYVSGVLSVSNRQLFESHFLCTEDRRQRLETIKSLVNVLGQMELPGRAVSAERPRRSLPHAERPSDRSVAIAHHQLTQEMFTQLLNWLDADYQRAAEKLLKIRDRLVKLFTVRGVSDAEELADETIDRVASKVAEIFENYVGDPTIYFYAVAKKMMLERARERRPAFEDVSPAVMEDEGLTAQKEKCLSKCLEHLSQEDRDLIFQFYGSDKAKLIKRKEELARSLGISLNALRVRMYTIRKSLEKCIKSCLQDEQDQTNNR